MITNLTEQLRRDEGEKLHAYSDHLGFLTIGIGRLIDKRKGGGISQEESAYLLANDIRQKTGEVIMALPWAAHIDPVRFGVLQNMAFQMGTDGLVGFRNTLKFIEAGEYERAGANMRASKWHSQTPARCERLIKQLITGEWQ